MDLKLKIPPAVVWLAAALLMWAIDRTLPVDWFTAFFRTWLAAAVALPGGLLGLFGILAFYRQSTTINPHKPEHTEVLVTGGIYRCSRNPMYLGLLLVLAAVGLYLGNPATAVVLPLFVWYMNRFQIKPEEQVMEQKFGADYTRYRSQVRRWI